MSACCQYETDLTDEQWEVLHPLLPVRQWHPGGPGRPPRDRRRVINGILYVNKALRSRSCSEGQSYMTMITALRTIVLRRFCA